MARKWAADRLVSIENGLMPDKALDAASTDLYRRKTGPGGVSALRNDTPHERKWNDG